MNSDTLVAVGTAISLGALGLSVAVFSFEERDKRRTREREQAERVYAWWESGEDGLPWIHVANESDRAILGVTFSDLALQPNKAITALIEPHEISVTRWDGGPTVPSEGKHPVPIVFIDAAGRWWNYWALEGVPGDPSDRRFKGKVLERRTRRLT